MVVLDASALLAVLGGEAGADLVMREMRGAHVSVVNVAEVLAKTAERGVNPDETAAILSSFQFRTRAFREGHALAAAKLRPLTASLGLSFGDRACLVQGQFSDLPILTSDQRLARAQVGLDIRLIR